MCIECVPEDNAREGRTSSAENQGAGKRQRLAQNQVKRQELICECSRVPDLNRPTKSGLTAFTITMTITGYNRNQNKKHLNRNGIKTIHIQQCFAQFLVLFAQNWHLPVTNTRHISKLLQVLPQVPEVKTWSSSGCSLSLRVNAKHNAENTVVDSHRKKTISPKFLTPVLLSFLLVQFQVTRALLKECIVFFSSI